MTAPPHDYTEDSLVERPAVALFRELGWETTNLFGEWTGTKSSEGRVTERDVVLAPRLRKALARLNPTLPENALSQAIDQAVEELTRDRSKLVRERANQEVYQLLKDGVKVNLTDQHGRPVIETVRVIDWRQPKNNDFLLASQFWVSGDMYRRRCDLVGFVNGVPLVLFELKASHKTLKSAYDDNLRDYRVAIPQLFTYNAFVVLSNGSKTVMGSTYAPWKYFPEWKRINDEGEKGLVSLETVIRGVCDQERLLDIVENFTVFEESKDGLIKKVAYNHQYLGVNQALHAVDNLGVNKGRLGVVWHTTGGGKSLSMVFFTQKIHRTVSGNWTFIIVTDRDELDRQIYKTFAATGAVSEAEAHATSCAHLQQLLSEDHRYVFTLIQKFRTEGGAVYPMLSERRDIIVITDEAHRSQYDTFALNMRTALPNAAFLGFTGTPLIVGEERTKEVFGDYISVYNFAQSIEDGATVPLYYENRIPELQLTNENLSEDLERLLEEAELNEAQERKVEREFAREYHLITREERLELVAEDIVQHFMGRGHRGKAMVICIDKATAIRMYNKVQVHWTAHLDKLKTSLPSALEAEREMLTTRITEMETIDMAVVVSQGQNEAEDLAAKGLDILPHRRRMVEQDMDEKFKDARDPLRLVFVCAKWITGFDVPSCSTLYLDKPMRNHSLIQTISRANRNYPGKQAGLIVDYVGVFRNLQKALAIYGSPKAGEGGESPIKVKEKLLEFLKGLLVQLGTFCQERGIDCGKIKAAPGFQKVALLDDAVDALIATEEDKNAFMAKVVTACRVYRAILPDVKANEVTADVILFSVLAQKIRGLSGGEDVDISHVMEQVEDLLDRSVAADPYVMPAGGEKLRLVDLSRIDFDKLRTQFDTGRKRTEVEKLRALISEKLYSMVARNKMRADFLERFQKLIDAYNSGSQSIEAFFAQLCDFAQSLNEEDQRAMREGLTEEELAMFDILTKPEPNLSEKEKAEVKKVCKELLEKLKAEKLVLDWRSRQQALAAVKQTVGVILDLLPRVYSPALYEKKCDLAFRHVYDCYAGNGDSVYVARAA